MALILRKLSVTYAKIQEKSFIQSHLKKIRLCTLSDIINDTLYCDVLQQYFPKASRSQEFLTCILNCKKILATPNSFHTIYWNAFFATIPTSAWKYIIMREVRQYKLSSDHTQLTEKLKHLEYDCIQNLKVNYDYILFVCEVRRKTRTIKHIFAQVYSERRE